MAGIIGSLGVLLMSYLITKWNQSRSKEITSNAQILDEAYRAFELGKKSTALTIGFAALESDLRETVPDSYNRSPLPVMLDYLVEQDILPDDKLMVINELISTRSQSVNGQTDGALSESDVERFLSQVGELLDFLTTTRKPATSATY